MEKNDFVRCLDNIATANEEIQNQSRSVIIDMRSNNTSLFFNLIFQVFEDNNSTFSQIVICLSAIRDMLIPTEDFGFSQIIKNWKSDFMEEVRVPLKNFIISFIHNEEDAIRNVSASIFALIFAIEQHELTENNWPQAISNLVDEFISEGTVGYCKHGIMTFFHELMILPIFEIKIKKNEDFVQYIGPEISRFLFQLIQNLEKPDSNPIAILDYSILCIYDLITYVPEVFNGGKEITLLLNSYESALPLTDSAQYQKLFEIIYQIIVNYYDHMSDFMETIFNLSSKGIDCPNDELVCISIEFWIQFTKYEAKIPKSKNNYQFTQTAIDPLIKLLLNVISQNKEDTLIQSINLLRILSKNYQEKTINISIQIIESLINNDEDMIGVFVSLSLIRGICSEKGKNFDKLIGFFERISNLIILGFSSESEIDDLIPFSAILAANRMIISCRLIANCQDTFDFLLYLYQNQPINPNFVYPILQLSIALFSSTTHELNKANFSKLFEILFKSIDDPSMAINEECLKSIFSALKYLVNGTYEKDHQLQDYYPKVEEKLNEYIALLSDSPDELIKIKLDQTLQLINIFIIKLSVDFLPFVEVLLTNSLSTCAIKFQNFTFDNILIILSSLCLHLKNKMFDLSEFLIEHITIGFKQDPSIISQTFTLCADFIINVNNSKVELIEQMFNLVDSPSDQIKYCIPEDQIQLIIPSFIKEFARMFLKIKYNLDDFRNGDFIWPEEILDRFYDIVDKQIESKQLSIDYEQNSPNFNYYNAARIYEGYFYAYAAYYKYQKVSKINYNKAVNIIIKKVIWQCKNTKAYDCNTAIALCKLLKKLFKNYKNKIVRILKNKSILRILTDNPEYLDDLDFKCKIDKTIGYIENTNLGPLEEELT